MARKADKRADKRNTASPGLTPEQIWKAKADRFERAHSVLTERIKLLEEENAALTAELRRHGHEVNACSQVSQELPLPLCEPIENDALADMLDAERILMAELVADEEIFFIVCSNSCVDVGKWATKGRVWLCTTADELILFAAGKTPFAEKIPFRLIQRTIYNHVTGDLVLAPAQEIKLKRITLSPLDGYQVMAQLYAEYEEIDE